MNYNEEGLLNLKKEIEQYYNIKLKFSKDFFDFPNFIILMKKNIKILFLKKFLKISKKL